MLFANDLLDISESLKSLVTLFIKIRISHMNGVEANNMFAIKSLMKASPYRVLLISFIFSVAQMTYCLRMFEGT